MSAPDPKAWVLTGAEMARIYDSVVEHFNGGSFDVGLVDSTCEAVARRRALEELRALLTLPSYVNHSEIEARIAEIEAEEA